MLREKEEFKDHVDLIIKNTHTNCVNNTNRERINAHSDFLLLLFKIKDMLEEEVIDRHPI